MSRSVWLAGRPARDVTSVCIIRYLGLCVCVCVYQCWVTQSQDLSSPYKIFTRPALATVSGGGGRLNIENRHFILNWSWFKATHGWMLQAERRTRPKALCYRSRREQTVRNGNNRGERLDCLGGISDSHTRLYQWFNQLIVFMKWVLLTALSGWEGCQRGGCRCWSVCCGQDFWKETRRKKTEGWCFRILIQVCPMGQIFTNFKVQDSGPPM